MTLTKANHGIKVTLGDSTRPYYGQNGPCKAVNKDGRVVVYDDRGGLLAARLWWMLHAYGHQHVALLDGGWVQWTAERRPTTTAAALSAL